MGKHEVGENLVAMFDPSGSIFLPQTTMPDVEFERWRQQIIFGRGAFNSKKLTAEQTNDLLNELERVRDWALGHEAGKLLTYS